MVSRSDLPPIEEQVREEYARAVFPTMSQVERAKLLQSYYVRGGPSEEPAMPQAPKAHNQDILARISNLEKQQIHQ